jgi:D-galactarolactone cycloisomerase
VKIEGIRTYRLEHQLDEPFGFSQWSYSTRRALLVEVLAEGGASGWGECYGPAEVTQKAITSFYAPLLRGREALATDAIWHALWQASCDYARRGVMMGAISGIDMALWDLKGKVLGLPCAELMGGRLREQVPCYATGMYFKEMPEEQLIDRLCAEAVGYRGQGFGAMKIKVGKNVPFDLRLIAAMRRTLPQVTLMADANHAYDLPEAIRVGRALDEHGYAWFEEPLSPELPGVYRQLHEKLDIALAAGECEQTRWGFQSLLAAGGVQVAQPDLGFCGGPSEALKIRNVASSFGVNVVPHAWGTMFNLAAALHLLASGYQEPGRAEVAAAILEYDRTANPLRDDIFEKPLSIEHGIARVPVEPGLGVTVDRQAMHTFCVEGTETP